MQCTLLYYQPYVHQISTWFTSVRIYLSNANWCQSDRYVFLGIERWRIEEIEKSIRKIWSGREDALSILYCIIAIGNRIYWQTNSKSSIHFMLLVIFARISGSMTDFLVYPHICCSSMKLNELESKMWLKVVYPIEPHWKRMINLWFSNDISIHSPEWFDFLYIHICSQLANMSMRCFWWWYVVNASAYGYYDISKLLVSLIFRNVWNIHRNKWNKVGKMLMAVPYWSEYCVSDMGL